MSTAAEQEAERRFPYSDKYDSSTHWMTDAKREDFVAGAKWALEQHRELLEAAREYRGMSARASYAKYAGDRIVYRLLAAVLED